MIAIYTTQHYLKKYSLGVVLFILLFFNKNLISAQEFQAYETYQSQIIGGVNLNTNGGLIGGVMFRYNRHIRNNIYHYFGLEITNVKHPKEALSLISSTGNIYTRHKANIFLPIRLQYGREFLLFQPAQEEGVEINLILGGGLSLGVVKPYMIEYDYNGISKIEPYDPDKGRAIIGKGPALNGFEKSRIVPGLNVKAGLSLEFAQFRANVTGIEVGVLLETYSSKIEIMKTRAGTEQPYNASTFTSVYLNIFFGFRN